MGARVDTSKGGYPVVHGRASSYRHHGCRCDACREAATVAGKKSRQAMRRRGLPDNSTTHGTVTGYTVWECRCDECRAAQRDYEARLKLRHRAYPLPPGDNRHGTYNGYNHWGCRCDACRAANAYRTRTRAVG